MKTTDLIDLLSEDAAVHASLGRALALAFGIGVLGSGALLLATVGVRPGMGAALETLRVAFKVCVTLLAAVAAAGVVWRIGRPGRPVRRPALLLLVPLALLAAAVAAECLSVPAAGWGARLLGRHALFCLFFIPVLSLLPLAGLLLALRLGAPQNPGRAGASAGLAAGTIAAALYAWHCPDDSPLFVATWYGLAIGLMVLAGWLVGRRVLVW
ncbi:NrsF family protein [Pseudoxanthobacter sp.]|uniref:NrsF family protein n=1 Tax=Pseudoxanthobacter sp. TaxID=1925742 RepID=UPI002FDF111B